MSLTFPKPQIIDPSDVAGFLDGFQDATTDKWKVAFQTAEFYVLKWMGMSLPPSLQQWDGASALSDYTYTEIFKWNLVEYQIEYRAGWSRTGATGFLDVPFPVKSAIIKVAQYFWKQSNLENEDRGPELEEIASQRVAIMPLIAPYTRTLPFSVPDRYCLLKAFPVLPDSVVVKTKDFEGNFTSVQTPGEIDLEDGIVDLWACNSEFPE